jgi:hypothetical protein
VGIEPRLTWEVVFWLVLAAVLLGNAFAVATRDWGARVPWVTFTFFCSLAGTVAAAAFALRAAL